MTALANSPTKNASVKTPQELVHIKHKISLRQYKYWMLALRAYRDAYEQKKPPGDDGFYRIPVATITELFDYEPVRKELRDDMEALRKEAIIYNVLGKDGKSVLRGAGFISEWEVAATWVGFKLPAFLEESVQRLDLKNTMFQQINWSVFNSFSGKYEAIIYKLCKDYVGVGRTPWIEIDRYREYMGLDAQEYREFKDLNKYTISGPVKRINENEVSDIQLDVEFKKTGRKITALQFQITWNRQPSFNFGESAFGSARISIASAQQKKYLKMAPPGEITLAIERANEYADEKAKEGTSVNLGAIYNTAITHGWGKERADKIEAEEVEKAKKLVARKKEVSTQQKTTEATESRAELRKRALEDFMGKPEEAQQVVLAQFRETLKGPPLAAFLKNGLEHPLVKPAFASWLVMRAG